ncbi:hypothetical protein EDI29_16995 [Pectobacterium polonicum]|nr:hypothetical protein EDI29_16995 [Pectobacterium polonicum]
MNQDTSLKADNNRVKINKSSIIYAFLAPTFLWCFLSFLYAFFCGERYSDTNFFNSWDLVAGIIISSYIILVGFVSICLHFIIKKYFIVTMASFIFLFIITVIDLDYIDLLLFFIILLTIPIFGSLTLKYLHKKHAHHAG